MRFLVLSDRGKSLCRPSPRGLSKSRIIYPKFHFKLQLHRRFNSASRHRSSWTEFAPYAKCKAEDQQYENQQRQTVDHVTHNASLFFTQGFDCCSQPASFSTLVLFSHPASLSLSLSLSFVIRAQKLPDIILWSSLYHGQTGFLYVAPFRSSACLTLRFA